MKLSFGSIVLGAIVVAVAAFGLVWGLDRWQQRQLDQLSAAIASLQAETVPLRFMIIDRSADTVTVRVRFYNLADQEIAMLETTLAGQQLFFDFLAAPLYAS